MMLDFKSYPIIPHPLQLRHGIFQHGLHLHGQNGMQTHEDGVDDETVVVDSVVVTVEAKKTKIRNSLLKN